MTNRENAFIIYIASSVPVVGGEIADSLFNGENGAGNLEESEC